MVQRQPADKHILGRGFDRRGHGADVGQQVGVCECHALGLPGAARRVLDEGDVVRPDRHRGRRLSLACSDQVLGCVHRPKTRYPGLEQARHLHRFGHAHQQNSPRVGEDAGVAAHMVFELRRSCRRVDRHRNTARTQDAQVGEKVGRGSRQHDGHRLARLQPGPLQTGRQCGRCVVQLSVADGGFGLVGQVNNLHLVRMGR